VNNKNIMWNVIGRRDRLDGVLGAYGLRLDRAGTRRLVHKRSGREALVTPTLSEQVRRYECSYVGAVDGLAEALYCCANRTFRGSGEPVNGIPMDVWEGRRIDGEATSDLGRKRRGVWMNATHRMVLRVEMRTSLLAQELLGNGIAIAYPDRRWHARTWRDGAIWRPLPLGLVDRLEQYVYSRRGLRRDLVRDLAFGVRADAAASLQIHRRPDGDGCERFAA
jgi:hypothetical protein